MRSASPSSTGLCVIDGLHIAQPVDGYRVNVDSLHLAHFAAESARLSALPGPDGGPRPLGELCDLGAGSGIVGLWLLHRNLALRGTFVEIQAEQAAHCQRNLEQNRLLGRVLEADVASLRAEPRFALVVSNPPYFEHGRQPHNEARRMSRFGNLGHFVAAAARVLGERGRACFVYPASSTNHLFETLRASGLEPKRARFVHGSVHEPARLVLVEARRAKPGGLRIEPPVLEDAHPARPCNEP